ncbi:MAG: dephospho-CoA kinase [Planctomycetota bacterium]
MFAGKPIIGLVGGIGAGKSTVSKLFGDAGCRVISSDELVALAYTHPAVKRAVFDEFGDEALDQRGNVDKAALSRIVFRQPEKRQFLEQLLHPVVNKARVELMAEAAEREETKAFVWDSPLLMETRLDELCDAVVFVDAPLLDRQRRVLARGWDAGELERRENVQTPLDKKRSRADHVVVNADDTPATGDVVSAILRTILEHPVTAPTCCGGGCGSGGCQSQAGPCGASAAGSSGCGCSA